MSFLTVILIFPFGWATLSAFHSRHPLLDSDPLIARIGMLLLTWLNVNSAPSALIVTSASLDSIPLNLLLKVLFLLKLYVLVALSHIPPFFRSSLKPGGLPFIISVFVNSVIVCSAITPGVIETSALILKHIAVDSFNFLELILYPFYDSKLL